MVFYTGHVPQSHKTDDFTFLPLSPQYTQLDYDALMASRPTLRAWGSGTWPRDDFTLEENQADLQRHWDEFETGKAYAYTILNPDESRCEGCFYTDQLVSFLNRFGVSEQIDAKFNEHDTLASFWIREERLSEEAKLLDILINWLKSEWAFPRVFFLTNNNNDRQAKLFGAAGMQKHIEWSRNGVIWTQYLMK